MTVRAVASGLLVIFLVTSAHAQRNWSVGLNALLRDCLSPSGQKKFVDTLRSCVQKRALIAMDAVFSDDVIPVFHGIELVRYKDGANRTATEPDTNRTTTREIGKTWGERVFGRFAKIFRTHVLKIDMDMLTGGTSNPLEDGVVEGRRRHKKRQNQMMSMMMMGILLMGSVLIPMGFQFLAVLGGKALILAKLALMLSSIQGLKKIATNGVNYGLYQGPPDGWHDRSQHEFMGPYEVPYQPYQPYLPPRP